MLSMTRIPESAEVTKKIMIILMTRMLEKEVSGRYSKNRKVRASGAVASALSAPSARWKSNQMALFPKMAIKIKLKKVGRNRTAHTNSLMVRPFEIRPMNSTTTGDHDNHHAQYRMDHP